MKKTGTSTVRQWECGTKFNSGTLEKQLLSFS